MLGVQLPDTRVLEVAGPATQHACSAAWGWRLGVCFSCWLPCLALRRLSLGHPSLGAARLDHTGGTAGDQWRTVLVGPW